MKKITNSVEQTYNFGENFAKGIKQGQVFLMVGDLGSGKTAFVKGVGKGLGIKKIITSPTFVLMKVYKVLKNKNIQNLVHVDTYRGVSENDLASIGALEYFLRDDSLSFVEWGKGLEKFLQKNKIKFNIITIKNISENKREIIIK